ncbi:MAG: alpha/beta hydrolase [Treponema sp.]|jgi:acetyl esterase/lipase|nr:alpha/beta hydrolase [Treponema sp.]
MRTFTLDLWEGLDYQGDGKDDYRPSLDAYILKSEAPRPAVLVLPGSGYVNCSPREAEALAIRFNAAGYHSFILWYSCAPRLHPLPILDCCRALTIIRENADDYKLNPEKVAMLGFSAGGHLALSQTLFHQKDFAKATGITPALCRADALLLAYPVITSGIYANRNSFNALLGESPGQKLLELLSLEKQVDANNHASLPPVFLWHTYTDESVLVENSFLLAEALRRASVPLEMHIFPEGKHGLSLAIPETRGGDSANVNLHTAQWFNLCLNWLKLQFGII